MKTCILYFILLFLFYPFILYNQDDILQPVDNPSSAISSLLGSDENTIKQVRIISESADRLALEIEFSGFDDKNYKLKATALNRSKKPLKELESVMRDLPSKSSSLEISLELKQKTGSAYTDPYIHTKYLNLSICDANDALCDFDLGGINIMGTSYLYHLDKKWRISGVSSNIVVKVKLVPYKSAASIKP